MSVFSRILDYMRHGFSWTQPKEATSTPTRDEPRRPAERDWTDSLTVNSALTKGLYHNSYPGMKLAGGLAFAPIIMPVLFMGLPVPEPVDPEDEKTKEVCQQILDAFSKDIKQIHIESHRDGTCWIWPHYSAKNKELVWEFIPDDTICDIFRDLSTGHIVKIMTDEEIKITVAENTVVTVRRKRIFTETLVTESWVSGTSMLPAELKSKTFTNVSGILPIPFSNNSDGDEVRGHSDYERIVTDLKDYHDIDLKTSVMWTKFNIKQVQEVEDVEKWRAANGLSASGALMRFDISAADLIFNLAGKEKTAYIFPTGALEAGERRLVTKFRKIVEESLIPELAWGVKVEGNMASADKQIEGMVMYVNDKREQKNEPYKKLFQASIQLLNIANMRREAPAIKITWNKLDAISELTKAQIFQALMTGIAQIMGAAGITKQILYNIVKKNYPEATQETLDEFILGLSDMAQFKQYVSATYTDVYDMQNGIVPEEPPAPGEPPDGTPPGEEPLPADQQRQIDGPTAQTNVKKKINEFNPDQTRDERGQWTGGGGSSGDEGGDNGGGGGTGNNGGSGDGDDPASSETPISLDKEGSVESKYGYVSASITQDTIFDEEGNENLSDEKYIMIDRVQSYGNGSPIDTIDLLDTSLNVAVKTEMPIRLLANPIGQGGLDQEQLISFYGHFGFEVSAAEQGMSSVVMEYNYNNHSRFGKRK